MKQLYSLILIIPDAFRPIRCVQSSDKKIIELTMQGIKFPKESLLLLSKTIKQKKNSIIFKPNINISFVNIYIYIEMVLFLDTQTHKKISHDN